MVRWCCQNMFVCICICICIFQLMIFTFSNNSIQLQFRNGTRLYNFDLLRRNCTHLLYGKNTTCCGGNQINANYYACCEQTATWLGNIPPNSVQCCGSIPFDPEFEYCDPGENKTVQTSKHLGDIIHFTLFCKHLFLVLF